LLARWCGTARDDCPALTSHLNHPSSSSQPSAHSLIARCGRHSPLLSSPILSHPPSLSVSRARRLRSCIHPLSARIHQLCLICCKRLHLSQAAACFLGLHAYNSCASVLHPVYTLLVAIISTATAPPATSVSDVCLRVPPPLDRPSPPAIPTSQL
jgi:hypothetical protein